MAKESGRRPAAKTKSGGWMNRRSGERENLLDRVQAHAEARLLAIGSALVNDTRLGRFVECRGDVFQCFGGVIFLSGSDERQILAFQAVQAGFHAAVLSVFAGTAPHASFG